MGESSGLRPGGLHPLAADDRPFIPGPRLRQSGHHAGAGLHPTFPCGPSETCYLSYEPANTRARALYLSMGFAETGDMDEDEAVAVMQL